jgi:tetratricopeptide (TPR) repeat protein
LITRATAKGNAGEYDRVREDFDEALALARVHDPTEVSRVHSNLGSILLDLGDIPGAIRAAREAVAFAERTGTLGGFGEFALGNLAETLFLAGEWDEAETTTTVALDLAERSGGSYHEPLYHCILSEFGLVRDGRVGDAAAAARGQVSRARERGDDQAVFPIFTLAAWTLARTGYAADASELLDELLARRRARPRGFNPGYWTMFCALSLQRIGRSGALSTLDEPPGSRFLEAALGVDTGRFEDAADTLREIGASPLEAEVRVLAARELAVADEAAAEGHLARARELLRDLGATARLRELDEVPAS